METQTAPQEVKPEAPVEKEPTEKELFVIKLRKETSMHRKYEMLMEYAVKYDLPKTVEYLKHIDPASQTSAKLRQYWEIAVRVVTGEERPRQVDEDYETKPIVMVLLHLWLSQGTGIYLDTTHKDVIALNSKCKKKILKVEKLEPNKEKKEVKLIME